MVWEVREHTADVALGFEGESLEGLLRELTAGVRFLYAGEWNTAASGQIRVRVEARTPEELLVKWVNELIFLFDARGQLVLEATGVGIEQSEGRLVASGNLHVCNVNAVGLKPRTVLKAATYHGLEVVAKGDGRLRAVLVIDT